eukprot:TRINITY_DN3010_c0_g1_i4.p1 TRINITY_DN3010_c0_g1~~TRINITY_DN3010_c0_g1_i4.p1  ORF type:complete len:1039 (-),score=215.97 TRINITY_DN3010_c0_g1_i4:226-2970(-)
MAALLKEEKSDKEKSSAAEHCKQRLEASTAAASKAQDQLVIATKKTAASEKAHVAEVTTLQEKLTAALKRAESSENQLAKRIPELERALETERSASSTSQKAHAAQVAALEEKLAKSQKSLGEAVDARELSVASTAALDEKLAKSQKSLAEAVDAREQSVAALEEKLAKSQKSLAEAVDAREQSVARNGDSKKELDAMKAGNVAAVDAHTKCQKQLSATEASAKKVADELKTMQQTHSDATATCSARHSELQRELKAISHEHQNAVAAAAACREDTTCMKQLDDFRSQNSLCAEREHTLLERASVEEAKLKKLEADLTEQKRSLQEHEVLRTQASECTAREQELLKRASTTDIKGNDMQADLVDRKDCSREMGELQSKLSEAVGREQSLRKQVSAANAKSTGLQAELAKTSKSLVDVESLRTELETRLHSESSRATQAAAELSDSTKAKDTALAKAASDCKEGMQASEATIRELNAELDRQKQAQRRLASEAAAALSAACPGSAADASTLGALGRSADDQSGMPIDGSQQESSWNFPSSSVEMEAFCRDAASRLHAFLVQTQEDITKRATAAIAVARLQPTVVKAEASIAEVLKELREKHIPRVTDCVQIVQVGFRTQFEAGFPVSCASLLAALAVTGIVAVFIFCLLLRFTISALLAVSRRLLGCIRWLFCCLFRKSRHSGSGNRSNRRHGQSDGAETFFIGGDDDDDTCEQRVSPVSERGNMSSSPTPPSAGATGSAGSGLSSVSDTAATALGAVRGSAPPLAPRRDAAPPPVVGAGFARSGWIPPVAAGGDGSSLGVRANASVSRTAGDTGGSVVAAATSSGADAASIISRFEASLGRIEGKIDLLTGQQSASPPPTEGVEEVAPSVRDSNAEPPTFSSSRFNTLRATFGMAGKPPPPVELRSKVVEKIDV